jgi:hypothetical protein
MPALPKTRQNKIDRPLGTVNFLFMDEVYSLCQKKPIMEGAEAQEFFPITHYQ